MAARPIQLLSDDPLRSDDLGPRLETLRDRLVIQIPHMPPSMPILVSGDWGAGKTSLMLAVHDELVTQKERLDVHPVWFEAWRYETESLLLPALMRTIWETPGAAAVPNDDVKVKLWNAAVSVACGIGPSLAKFAGGPAPFVFDYLMARHADEKKAAARPSGPPVDQTSALRTAFTQLVGNDRRLVVFVDDLDRCSPEGAVALLDAIRLLLVQTASDGRRSRQNAPRCTFVVALDRTVLADSIARKFANISHYEGNRYLEKIFPIAFDLVAPNEHEIKAQLESSLRQLAVGPEPFRSYLDSLLAPLRDIHANPRLIKRCVNRYHLLRTLDDEALRMFDDKANHHQEESEQDVVDWIAATERWPALRRRMRRSGDDEDYWTQINTHINDKTGKVPAPDEQVRNMLRAPGTRTWLKEQFFSGGSIGRLKAFRSAEARLQRWGL
ncbi:MAG: P-loop NTPase fold protein [Acidobacteriota bacterium]